METPILLITLSTPLPSALTTLATAFSGSTRGVDPAAGQVLDRLDGQVRVDRGRAVADQQRDVVHLADVAGLDHQADLGPGLLPDQVVVHGRGEQQRRDRGELGVGVPVGQHDDPGAALDRRRDLGAELVELGRQRLGAAADLVQAAGHVGRRSRAGHRRG